MRLTAAAMLLAASVSAVAAPPAETVAIEVTHLTQGKQWHAEYRLGTAAERLEFLRRFDFRRHQDWHPDNADFELVQSGEIEVLRRRDGKPFDRVGLTFRSDRTPMTRDYQLNAAFTDGSEWLYTGQLYAVPVRTGRQPKNGAGFQMTFLPATGEGLVIDGRRHESGTPWRETGPDNAGTFVYFGSIEPLPSAGFPALIDPGLPAYLRRAFERFLPEIGELYRQRFGYALPVTPTLLITYDPTRGDYRGGDTLPSSIAFKLSGPAWAESSAENVEQATALIAHEMAHLWNGQRFSNDGRENAIWMHEGGADAIATLVLSELAVIDRSRFAARIEKAVNDCAGIAGLRKPLVAEFEQRHFGLAYSCGAVMNHLVDRAWAKRGGLFGFWRELFGIADKHGGLYSTADWIGLVQRENPALAAFIRAAWSGPRAPGLAEFGERLRAAGFEIRETDPPAGLQLQYAAQGLAPLMAEDCGGATNFWFTADGATVGGLPECRTLKAETIEVKRLAGRPFAAGREAYLAVRSACASAGSAEVGLEDGSALKLACPAGGLSAPPGWLAVSAVP